MKESVKEVVIMFFSIAILVGLIGACLNLGPHFSTECKDGIKSNCFGNVCEKTTILCYIKE